MPLLIDLLPLVLQQSAISLEPMDVIRYAWRAQDALDVVEFCRGHRIVIVGGDVIAMDSAEEMQYTYDNWYYEPDRPIPMQEQVDASCDYAHDRVTFYSGVHKDKEVIFDLVMRPPGVEV